MQLLPYMKHALILKVCAFHSLELNSFFCQTPSIWNSLPQKVVSSESLRSFKLHAWLNTVTRETVTNTVIASSTTGNIDKNYYLI